MVQYYSTGAINVSSNEGTLAPPGEYDWTCASFGPLESTTESANGSVQPFLHNLRHKVPILYNGCPYPPEVPFLTGIWTSHCMMLWAHASPQPKRHLDRFSRVCTDDRRVSLYGLPVSPSKLFLPMLECGPHVIHGSFIAPTRVRNANGNLIVSAFLQGSLVWQTDRSRWSTAFAYTNWS